MGFFDGILVRLDPALFEPKIEEHVQNQYRNFRDLDFSGPTRDNKMGQNSKLQRGQNCIGRGQSVRVRLPMPINVGSFMIVHKY